MNTLKKVLGIQTATPSLAHLLSDSSQKQEISDELLPIVQKGLIDATSKENEERYSHNLAVLIKRTKEIRKIERIKLIINDDSLPKDWQWYVQSRDTQFKLSDSPLTNALRYELAREAVGKDSFFGSDFLTDAELNSGYAKIGEKAGFIITPIGYRSTKHFTINSPLNYSAGIYNQSDIERDFIIIDDIDNFLSSGYAYSIHWTDAYLNVAHESLSISEKAVILINEDKFERIIQNPEMKNQLAERQVLLFRGDEGLAINMYLSEEGVLSAHPGTKYATIDNKTKEIMTFTLKELCCDNNLEYKIYHNEHFINKLDQNSGEVNETNQEFVNFFRKEFPEYTSKHPGNILISSEKMDNLAKQIVKERGTKEISVALRKYNNMVLNNFNARFKKYREDRFNMNSDIKKLFKSTFMKIRLYFKNHEFESYSEEDRKNIYNLIKMFFQGKTVQKQLAMAEELNLKLIDVKKESK